MIFSWLLYLLIFVQDEVPFKSKDEFEVKLNYSFKQRPPEENTTFRFEGQEKTRENQNSSSMLPYLVLKVKILKAPSTEVKLRVINNSTNKVFTKKIQEGLEFEIDMGFTDDVKDHVTAHEYTIYMQNEKHERQSKIVIFVKEDGAFLINDEVRGKL